MSLAYKLWDEVETDLVTLIEWSPNDDIHDVNEHFHSPSHHHISCVHLSWFLDFKFFWSCVFILKILYGLLCHCYWLNLIQVAWTTWTQSFLPLMKLPTHFVGPPKVHNLVAVTPCWSTVTRALEDVCTMRTGVKRWFLSCGWCLRYYSYIHRTFSCVKWYMRPISEKGSVLFRIVIRHLKQTPENSIEFQHLLIAIRREWDFDRMN